jgi:ribosomal protein S1
MKTEISEEVRKVLEESILNLHVGSIIEGEVIEIKKAAVYIDLGAFGTGIIYGKEYINARDIIKNIHVGDSIKAKIAEVQNAEGYTEISLKEARQALVWKEAEDVMKKVRF